MRLPTYVRRVVVGGGFLVAFVLVWSSGYIAGSIGTRTADPAALGFWRFVLAAVVLGIVVVARGPRWPGSRQQWVHLLVIGALLQNVQFTGAFIAIDLGMSAGLAALIADASPLVVAIGAAALFGEQLRRRQVVGLMVGFLGVGLVVAGDSAVHVALAGFVAAVIGLAGSSGGTIYQKGARVETDLCTGTFIQLLGAVVTMAPVAVIRGGFGFPLTATNLGVVSWLAGVGSILAFFLLFKLLEVRSGAQATSYLFLVPPSTAALGAVLLGQPLTPLALVGFLVAAVGVGLVALTRQRS